MSTQTIRTFRQRWITYLRSEGWCDQVVDRLGRLIGNNGRWNVASARAEPVKIRLVRNELMSFQEGNGLRVINVRQGVVWITCTPACGDIILNCGGRFETGDHWPYVLQALKDAEIELLT